MVVPRLATSNAMCPTCDALVAGLTALVAERPGTLPSAAELSARAGVAEADLVRHVGDPAGCFVLAFERCTDRALAAAEAQLAAAREPGGRLDGLVRGQLAALAEEGGAGPVIDSAPFVDDDRVQAAVIAWRERLTDAVRRAERTELLQRRSGIAVLR